MCLRANPAFTLAELLIALAILGEIATFTIPKVITAQQNKQKLAAAKQVAGIISAAYSVYKLKNTASASTTPGDLLQYINYIAMDTASSIDTRPGFTTSTCDSVNYCLKMHVGGILQFANSSNFSGVSSTNAIVFTYDADGQTDGTTNGPGKSVQFWLYYNGTITSVKNLKNGTTSQFGGPFTADPSGDPSWFSWD